MSNTLRRYQISHWTRYRYSESVAICQNQLQMIPRDFPRVICHSTELEISPKPTTSHDHTDYFGNHVHTFSIETLHRELTIRVRSDVEVASVTSRSPAETPAWETIRDAISDATLPLWYEASEYRFPSEKISLSSAFADYARTSFTPSCPILVAALELTKRIHREFKYGSGSTSVDTSAEKAFALRQGVCQDFAHVQIACLRSLGLAARYVSGYLRTIPPAGKPRLVGADQSHAWMSVYAGHDLGWIAYDPTNACMVGTDHIPICVGRDYRDVAPMRGVVLGGGHADLRVSVDVEPIAIHASY